jgi:hypothetical protein
MMMRTSGRFLILAVTLFATLGLGIAVPAEETLVWTEKSNGGFATLAYGSYDPAKGPLFLLSCFNSMGIAVLDLRTDIGGAKLGQPITIELAAGEAKAAVEGEVANDESSGTTFGEASDIEVKPVLAVLRAPGPLTVKVGEASTTLSDRSRAQAVGQFNKDCELD